MTGFVRSVLLRSRSGMIRVEHVTITLSIPTRLKSYWIFENANNVKKQQRNPCRRCASTSGSRFGQNVKPWCCFLVSTKSFSSWSRRGVHAKQNKERCSWHDPFAKLLHLIQFRLQTLSGEILWLSMSLSAHQCHCNETNETPLHITSDRSV